MTGYGDSFTKEGQGRGLGAKIRSDYATMDFIPAALDRDGICVAQTLGAAGALTLNGAFVTNGVAKLDDGVASFGRCVGIYSAGNLSALTFTVVGFDTNLAPMIEALAGPNNTTTSGKKAFRRVIAVRADGAVGTNVEVGTIDVFGLPMKLFDRSQVIRCGYNNTLAENAATVTPADTTSPATATTGDVRGTVAPSGATDGVKRLTVVHVVHMFDRQARFGVSQYAG